ncbi:MAG TPA: hypothetical protein VMT16_02865 [Thermoanaerobaculia bacterium]|nr:hypothetical protein [Thermoanaerobaculia bacterium]
MGKVKLTISIDQEVADYLRSTDGVSSTVEEAVSEYRARALERELEQGYQEGAEEAERLDAEWRQADAEVAG